MHVLAVDDEFLALAHLCSTIELVLIDSHIQGFQTADEALQYAKENHCDIAFLDIFMPETNGVELAQKLKETNPKINIIFVTASEEHFNDAFALHASGYLLKPVREESLRHEIQNLRYHLESTLKINVQTFGNFDVFVNGTVVKFSRAKAKEMLAFLVDQKGKALNRRELAEVLFEDKPYDKSSQNYLSQVIKDLQHDLSLVSADAMLEKAWNSYGINPDVFECDLYEFEKGNITARNTFQGEYMSQYSWAELTLARLCSTKGNR